MRNSDGIDSDLFVRQSTNKKSRAENSYPNTVWSMWLVPWINLRFSIYCAGEGVREKSCSWPCEQNQSIFFCRHLNLNLVLYVGVVVAVAVGAGLLVHIFTWLAHDLIHWNDMQMMLNYFFRYISQANKLLNWRRFDIFIGRMFRLNFTTIEQE